ncbi:MAG: iron-sulfur cluster assembly scaffold protein [Candidatus Contendobacter sp.]
MLELSAATREHFEHPRHVGSLNPDSPDVATALVGEPVSGAILQLYLRVDQRDFITAARFGVYGCGWMVACGSLLTEWLQGRTLVEAAIFRHHILVEILDVPPEKLYCAVLAETALKTALRAYAAKPTRTSVIQSDHP